MRSGPAHFPRSCSNRPIPASSNCMVPASAPRSTNAGAACLYIAHNATQSQRNCARRRVHRQYQRCLRWNGFGRDQVLRTDDPHNGKAAGDQDIDCRDHRSQPNRLYRCHCFLSQLVGIVHRVPGTLACKQAQPVPPRGLSLSAGSFPAIRSRKNILYKSFEGSRRGVLRRTRLQRNEDSRVDSFEKVGGSDPPRNHERHCRNAVAFACAQPTNSFSDLSDRVNHRTRR